MCNLVSKIVRIFFSALDIDDSYKEIISTESFEYSNPLDSKCSGFFVL